jgi:hypothetical protein
MTDHVRKSYRNHRKATWVAVLAVLASAALALVLPALAIDTSGGGVLPASGQGIAPSLANVGGSNFSCAAAGKLKYGDPGQPTGMRQFQISKPTPGTYTDPATGVKFVVTAPGAGKDPKSFFSFSVDGNAAVVYHIGVNGGTKTAWYDYFNNTPSAKALPNGGVFWDTNVHSTPDSKYTTSNPTFYVASITTFCYSTLTRQPSCTTPFSGIGFGGTGGTVEYSAQLVAQNGQCKGGNVVMYSYTPGTNQLFATLNPVTPGGTMYEVVEHIHWTGITGEDQNPITLEYDDTAPYNGVDNSGINNINGGTNDGWRLMKLCGSDPRPFPSDPPLAVGQSPFDLGGNTPAMPAADPLPAGGAHSTCMLQSTDSAGTGTSGRTYDTWLFSTVDGARNGG